MKRDSLRTLMVLFLVLAMLAVSVIATTPDDSDDTPATEGGGSGAGGSVGPAADTTPPAFWYLADGTYMSHSPKYPGPTTWVNVSANIYDDSLPVNVDIKSSGDNTVWTNVSNQNVTMPRRDATFRNPTSGYKSYYAYGYTYMSTGAYLNNVSLYCYTSGSPGMYVYMYGYTRSGSGYQIFYMYSSTATNGWVLDTNVLNRGFVRVYVYFRDYSSSSTQVYYQIKYDEVYERQFQIPPAGMNTTNYLKFTVKDTVGNSVTRYYQYSVDIVSPKVVDVTTFSGIMHSPTPLSIFANTTDNLYLDRCRLAWSTDNSTWNYVSMDQVSGSVTAIQFRGYLPVPSTNTTIFYWVEVFDKGSSTGRSQVETFVWDPPPMVTDLAATPLIINATGSSMITANITDTDGINSAFVVYRVGLSGTEVSVAMTKGTGDSWYASIGNFGVTASVYFHVTVYDHYDRPFSTPDQFLFVDDDPPEVTGRYTDPTYPNCNETVTVHLTVEDDMSPIEVWSDYKYGASGIVQSMYQGNAGQIMSNDRNPPTGYSYSSLSKYYYPPSGSVFGRVTLRVYSWDHEGVYVLVQGYSSSTGTQNIYYSTSTDDGIKLDTIVTSSNYERLYISFYDVSGTPIYYDLTYTTIDTSFSMSVPGPGYSTWVYYRARGIDAAGNSDASAWFNYWADGTIPIIFAHKSPGVKDTVTDIQVAATFSDESAIDRAQMFYTYGTDVWYLYNMTEYSLNKTHLGAIAVVPMTNIPLYVTYYFRIFDMAGNNNTTRTFTYRTVMADLTEGVFSDFDSSVLEAQAGIIKWQWDFDFNGTFNQDRGGQKVRYRYWDNGTYTARLMITDGNFATTNFTFTLVALDVGPTAAIDDPGSVSEGDLVMLDGRSSQSFPDPISLYEWDLDYDGTTFDTDATGPIYNHTFMSNKVYLIALRVTDDDGSTSLTTFTLDVKDVKPKVAVNFTAEANEGDQLLFNASGTVSWPDVLDRIEWDMDYDGTFNVDATGLVVNHTYLDNGAYRFAVRAYDNDGSMTQVVKDVTIDDLRPIPNITAVSKVDEGTPILLDARLSQSWPDLIVLYEWDLHYDGPFIVEATGNTTTFTYMDDGDYTVALRVKDDDGSTEMTVWDVQVIDLQPTANLSAPLTINEGTLVQMSTVATSYPDDIVSVEWDFVYDGVKFTRDALGMNVDYTYMDNGTYTVALRVTDDDGSMLLQVQDIDVVDLAPMANATVSGDFKEGGTLILDARPSTSYPDKIVSWAWDMDYDGTTFDVDMYGDVGEHVYKDDGTYTIAMMVTDDDGTESIWEQTVQIADLRPTAVITVNVLFHSEGSLVTFSAGSSTSAPDELVAYHWDWEGDGEVDETTTEVNGRHTFTKPGRYMVVLSVEDDDGSLDSTSVNITVTDVGPTARLEAVATPEGTPVLLDGSGSTEPGNDFVAFRWDLNGDMAWDEEGTESTLEHTWYEPGMYDITLQVEDEDGSKSTKGITLVIQDVSPTADAGGPYEVDEGTPITLDGTGSVEPGMDLTVFRWDVDGDGTYDGEGEELEWTFTLAGEYTIRLQVEDEDESTGEATTTIQVRDVDPVFAVSLPDTAAENLAANFTLVDLYDPGTDKYGVTWYFGDGKTAEGVSVQHVYDEDGTYNGRVEVTDNDGTTVTRSWPLPLLVDNSAPVVELSNMLLKATEDTEFTVSVYGQDTPNDTVTYDFKGPGGKIDKETGLFKWTPLNENVGSNKFTFIARDEDGGEGTLVVKIDVEDVDNDFPGGLPFATGMGIVIAVIVAFVLAFLLVTRMRKKASEEDVIEAKEKMDLKAPVEVDLDEAPAAAAAVAPKAKPPAKKAPPKKRPPEGRPPPRKRPPEGRPPPRKRPPGQGPPPKQRPPGQRPPPRKRPPGQGPPPGQRPPGQRPPPRKRPPGQGPPPGQRPPPRRRPPPGQRPPLKKKRPPEP